MIGKTQTLTLALAMGLMAPVAQAELIGVGDLPTGAFNSSGGVVSANGLVVAGTGKIAGPSGDVSQAFRWTAATGMAAIAGTTWSFPTDLSADGSVVVGSDEFDSVNHFTEAFRWTQAGGMATLTRPGGIYSAQALGCSADGNLIVGNLIESPTRTVVAGRWTQATGWVNMGDLAGGSRDAMAFATTSDGSVIVGFGTTAAGAESFRWTQAGGMVSIGDLPGGTVSSWARAVSDDGSVVIGFGTSGSGREGYRWTEGTGMVGLGDLPGGAFSSTAYTFIGNSSTLGGYATTAAGQEAAIWTQGTGWVRLWDQLVAQGLNPADTGWSQLSYINGASADGTVLSGHGIHNGNTEVFLLTNFSVVPSPVASVWSLAGMAVLGLVRRRKA